MPKNKIARKSTHIDMTAMTDVAFLLLTFFMLTAKARPQEPVQVDMSSSISETKLPDANTITILVDNKGKVFLDMAGVHTRARLAESMNATYNLGLDEKGIKSFATAGAFGVSQAQLKGWLAALPADRAKMAVPGIPCDTAKNELGPWIHEARLAQFQLKQEGKVSDEYVVVVKADSNTPYEYIQQVINTLTGINVNKFNLITNMESDPNKVGAMKK